MILVKTNRNHSDCSVKSTWCRVCGIGISGEVNNLKIIVRLEHWRQTASIIMDICHSKVSFASEN